jgi:anti-anti-sigma factor
MTASTKTTVATPRLEIVVTEELDSPAAARLRTLLGEALALRPDHLIVDLARCPLINAETVQVLLEAHRRTWHVGGQFTLRAPSPRVRRILELSRADHVLHIVEAPDEPGRALMAESRPVPVPYEQHDSSQHHHPTE